VEGEVPVSTDWLDELELMTVLEIKGLKRMRKRSVVRVPSQKPVCSPESRIGTGEFFAELDN